MAKESAEIIVEGMNINGMSWPALEKLVVEMTEKLILERGERARTRKECAVMRTCWQNSEKDLEEAKAKLLKKYVIGDTLWDKHKESYAEKDREINYQKFIVNYDTRYQEQENQKSIELINKNWEQMILPKMMESKTREAQRFDQKQKDLNKEYADVLTEYKKTLDDAVRLLDDKLLDWRVSLCKRIWLRVKYNELQFLLKKLYYSEQKNLLIHELKENHKINFEKTRDFVRERVEGDTMQIEALTQELVKLNDHIKKTSIEIEQFTKKIRKRQYQLTKLNKKVKLCKLKFINYKSYKDKAYRCSKQIEKLNMAKVGLDKRKLELGEEVKKRQADKQMYLDFMEKLHDQIIERQEKFFGQNFSSVINSDLSDPTKFEDLFAAYRARVSGKVWMANDQFFKEMKMLGELPVLITKELKGHNDFILAAMAKMREMGIPHVPNFSTVSAEGFPTWSGPAGLACI